MFQGRTFAVQWGAETTQDQWRWQGCPGDQLGTAGVSQVTQMLMFGRGMECQVSTVNGKNYTLEMPLSVGQGLEGRLRLDFQLLAGGMDHAF